MSDDDGKWLTFQQLATLRGTSKRAAVMLVRRHKWRRERDNQGHTIALVPAEWAKAQEPEDQSVPGRNDAGHIASNGTAHAVVVLEQALSALREAHARELVALRDAHDSEVARLRAEVAAARQAVEEAQAQAHSALQAVTRAELAASVAGERLKQLELKAATRRARRLLQRLRSVWR